MNRRYFDKVARWCYYPATEMFLDMLDQGFKLGLGFSVSFLWQLQPLGPELADALPHAGGPSQLRAGRRGALPQLRLRPRHQALPEGDDARQGLRGGVLRQRDPRHRHHRDGDEQRDLLRPAAGRLRAPACSTGGRGCWSGGSPPISTATTSATSACSAATTNCPTTWATASATRPGRATRCSADAYAEQPARHLGRLRVHRLGLRDVRRAPQRRHRASSTSCGRCRRSSTSKGVRCLTAQ